MTHPQRCETCQNDQCKYLHLKGDVGRTRKWSGGKLKGVTFTPTSFTEEMGCASHSSAQSEQSIRQDEREKVLEKIEQAHDCLITEIIHARAEDREYQRIKKAADILLGLKLRLRQEGKDGE